MAIQDCTELPTELLRWSRTRYDKLRRTLPGLQFIEQVRQGNRSNVLRHVEGVRACVDHEEALEFQVRKSRLHGRSNSRSRSAFDLKAPALSPANQKQVQFGTRMSRPKETLMGSYFEQPGHF